MGEQAVLFDLDGTLHDSDAAWLAALVALASRYDVVAVHESALAGLAGLSTPDAVELVLGRLGVRGDIPADVAWLEKRVAAEFLGRANWHPGALDLVRAARAAGLRTALVTSSCRLVVDSLLTGPVGELFDTVVTGDDVERVKPDPEPYLLAMRHLGLTAAGCVAVEDSATGEASAIAAGCRVVRIDALDRRSLRVETLRVRPPAPAGGAA